MAVDWHRPQEPTRGWGGVTRGRFNGKNGNREKGTGKRGREGVRGFKKGLGGLNRVKGVLTRLTRGLTLNRLTG